jgi:putative ABC transport system substrate-binding protein
MAASRVPIVFAGGGDPVGLGLIQSFARPGGNITGVTDLDQELGPKRLQLFWEIIPGLKRVVFLYDAADAYAASEAKGYREASRRLGLILVEKLVRTQEEAQRVLANVRRTEGQGILSPRSVSSNIPGLVAETTSKRAIPTMFPTTFFPELGGLASYGATTYESGRQAARLVDKILKGVNPARIPVEVNTNIEFVINVKVARTLGLTIAPELLYQADRLIR